LSLG
jgi:hypothetical protein